jgi:TPR repeat protein
VDISKAGLRPQLGYIIFLSNKKRQPMNISESKAQIVLAGIFSFALQCMVAFAIDNPNPIPQATIDWCNSALKDVEAGNSGRQGDLAHCYEHGLGMQQDLTKSVALWEKAASWNPDAQVHLGLMYERGKVIVKDSVKAAYWYQKAAARGYGPGQVYLGLMYSKGEGVPKDASKAAELFNKARAQEVNNRTEPNGNTFRARVGRNNQRALRRM